MSRMSSIAAVAFFVALSACASAPSPEGSRARVMDRNLLTAAELENAQWSNMYDAIAAMRGAWLNKRGPVSLSAGGELVVYLDRNRLGGPETLRTISCEVVASARFLSASEAQSQFGLDHPLGAIVIVSRLR